MFVCHVDAVAPPPCGSDLNRYTSASIRLGSAGMNVPVAMMSSHGTNTTIDVPNPYIREHAAVNPYRTVDAMTADPGIHHTMSSGRLSSIFRRAHWYRHLNHTRKRMKSKQKNNKHLMKYMLKMGERRNKKIIFEIQRYEHHNFCEWMRAHFNALQTGAI